MNNQERWYLEFLSLNHRPIKMIEPVMERFNISRDEAKKLIREWLTEKNTNPFLK